MSFSFCDFVVFVNKCSLIAACFKFIQYVSNILKIYGKLLSLCFWVGHFSLHSDLSELGVSILQQILSVVYRFFKKIH